MNQSQHFVSIIMPTFNAELTIIESVESVINQSYKKWELIIIDDSSNDRTREKVRDIMETDNRIKSVFLEKNLGAANARNVGLSISKGKFVAFLDSDDIWSNIKLEEQVDFMIKNQYSFTFTSYKVVDCFGLFKYTIKVPRVIGYAEYLNNTIIGCSTVMIDVSKVGNIKFPIIRTSHDMALWLNILKRGYKAYGLQNDLTKYRLVNSSITSKKYKAALDVWFVYRNIEGLTLLKSISCFMMYAINATIKRIHI